MTDFRDFDITFPALGPNDIVFQAGGRLYLLDLTTEKAAEVPVQVVTDRLTLKPRDREGRGADRVAQRVADGQARRVRGPRRRVHACRPSTAR